VGGGNARVIEGGGGRGGEKFPGTPSTVARNGESSHTDIRKTLTQPKNRREKGGAKEPRGFMGKGGGHNNPKREKLPKMRWGLC